MPTNDEIKNAIDGIENWEFRGNRGDDDLYHQFQNECGLWLAVKGSSVEKWVGNFHFPVKDGKEFLGSFENHTETWEYAKDWMIDNPDPWS